MLIEDDIEEQKRVKQVLVELGIKNSVEMFGNAEQALVYLQATKEKPFIMLTEMMLPGMSGLELLDQIYKNEYLKKKSIPFVFFGNVEVPDMIEPAFDRRVQGYFLKPKSFIVLKLTLMSITDYWLRSTHPNIS